jgi:3-methyl-2-oxobutanoate hydroxymethyltransferase
MTERKTMNLHRLMALYETGEKIAVLTCYDACFAHLLDEAGVDVLLVGDSLGMVLQGHRDTLAVTLEQTLYHAEMVRRGTRHAWIIVDMPFGSYHGDVNRGIDNAVRLMQAGAQMIKVEGAGFTIPFVKALTERGIPVCGHIGFTPQAVHALGGFKVQGRAEQATERMLNEAKALEAAGAKMIVIELTPSAVAKRITQNLSIPTIGIGAGVDCSGQVLVLHDLLGLTREPRPKFVENYLVEGRSPRAAIEAFIADVKAGRFPVEAKHGYA